MLKLEYLDDKRLELLPESYQATHQFCFFLHDQVTSALVQYNQANIHGFIRDSLEDVFTQKGLMEEYQDKNVIDILKDMDSKALYKKYLLSHLVLALSSDMLHFLYESLSCFEKRKFSVAFSLLRKPFKEHLLYLSWILADEEDFISRFEKDNYQSFSGVFKEKKIEIIKNAINSLYVEASFDAETIWNFIYDKNQTNGFEPTWQRATHLITSKGKLLQTEDYSFNFIFGDSGDDSFFTFLEEGLPYLFLYLTQITLACFNKIHSQNEHTINHLMFVSYGCYEALYFEETLISDEIQEKFGDLLKCTHCDSNFLITKENAPTLYLNEKFLCYECGLISEFPFYWLLAKSKLRFI